MLPFPIIFCQGREIEREGELEKIKEREKGFTSSLFQHHQKGNRDKISSSTSSLLDFWQQRGLKERKKRTSLHLYIYI